MRLLIHSTEFPPGPGGIGTHAYEIARQLSRRNWQVTVISRQDYASNAEIEKFNTTQPFKTLRLLDKPNVLLDGIYRVNKVSQELNGQSVIIASGERAVWVSAFVNQKVPLVCIGHGTEFGSSGWRHKLSRWAFEKADHVVCVSNFTRDYMMQKGYKPKAVTVIPNGADETRFHSMESAANTAAVRAVYPNSHLLLTVGNVTERKGQHVVIRALPYVLKQFPNVHYLIAGLPTERDTLQQLAKSLGIEDHVHFLGRVPADHLISLFYACDIFLMTSVHTATGDFEGYGIAAVEAALCGKASIVSDGSGLSEAIIDHETGLVARQNDPASTAEAIIKLLANDTLRTALGNKARTRALAEQTWSKRADVYHELFLKIARN